MKLFRQSRIIAALAAAFTAAAMIGLPTMASASGGRLVLSGGGFLTFVDADGSNFVEANQASDTASWSPDGSKIARSEDVNGDGRSYSIKIENADRSAVTTVTQPQPNYIQRISWSPDGRRLVFGSYPDVWVVNVDGTGLTQLTDHTNGTDGSSTYPSWSPDGTKIAYSTDRDGYVCADQSFNSVAAVATWTMNPDGSGKTRVSPSQDGGNGYFDSYQWPEWSPGSSSTADLAYDRTRQNVTYNGLFYDCGTTGLPQIYVGGQSRTMGKNVSLSPDGAQIAFDRPDGYVYVAARDGSNVRQVAGGSVLGGSPDWRPVATTFGPACSDGLDNDSDGKIDYPADTGCSSASDTTEDGPNLLKNSSFELDANADGRPDNWTGNAAFSRTSAVRLTASYSGRHRSTANSSYSVSQAVPAAAGKRYAISESVDVPPTTDAFTYKVVINWRNASNAVVGTTLVKSYSGATNGWLTEGAEATAPRGATKAQIVMAVSSLNATFYVDNFSFWLR